MTPIYIEIDGKRFHAALDGDAAPRTVSKIIEKLPIKAVINRWGDEIYFQTSVLAKLEGAVESVSIGDLAFWPEGNAFCIFFGKTPLSKSEHEIIPASAVNPIGRIEDIEGLKQFKGGEAIKITLDDKG